MTGILDARRSTSHRLGFTALSTTSILTLFVWHRLEVQPVRASVTKCSDYLCRFQYGQVWYSLRFAMWSMLLSREQHHIWPMHTDKCMLTQLLGKFLPRKQLPWGPCVTMTLWDLISIMFLASSNTTNQSVKWEASWQACGPLAHHSCYLEHGCCYLMWGQQHQVPHHCIPLLCHFCPTCLGQIRL